MQLLFEDYPLTYSPLLLTRYSFTQLIELGHRADNENAQYLKRYQRGFEPGPARLNVRHFAVSYRPQYDTDRVVDQLSWVGLTC